MSRPQPNIIITGTPGVGKTSHSTLLAANDTTLTHLPINNIVKDHSCHEGWSSSFSSYIVDEDKLLDVLESAPYAVPTTGGFIIDWHACDLFPESWIDLVVVLRADSAVLYDRLVKRGYDERKLQENLDAEIMGVLAEEAREGFEGEGVVVELRSDEDGDLEGNVGRVEEWVRNWRENKEKEKEASGS